MLLFVDNIFRFVQAGSEVSALSAACPPRWATSRRWPRRWAPSRSASPRPRGSVTSMQAVYVPADDITDPAPVATFAHLDSTIILDRAISELGIYPAVDPLKSTSRMLDPQVVGEEHYDVARDVQQTCSATPTSRTSSPSSASRSSRRGQGSRRRARRIQKFLAQPFFVAEQFTGTPGRVRPARGHRALLQGDPRGQARRPARGGLLHGTDIEDRRGEGPEDADEARPQRTHG